MRLLTLRTALRVVAVLVAFYGFWVFMQPLAIAGIVNVGNVVGMGVSVLLAFVAVAWPELSRLVSALLERRSGRIVSGGAWWSSSARASCGAACSPCAWRARWAPSRGSRRR